MAENKTRETNASVEDYFKAIKNEKRRKDCQELATLMSMATGYPPRMWGSSIVGFGSYHYRYESGREGDSCIVGFSSRKGDISLYGLMTAADIDGQLARLGRFKTGKSCIYVKSLGDVDLKVLTKIVAGAAVARRQRHEQSSS